MVGREGIEPPQPKAAGLQPAELTTCSTYPLEEATGRDCGPVVNPSPDMCSWSRRRDSNPEPAVYKTAALPIELRRRGAGSDRSWTPWRREMIRSDRRTGQASGPGSTGGRDLPLIKPDPGRRAGAR